ncbi:MAG: hypothetical protein M1835_008215 [Candelina submexicana]|nr:MAG: hypothetical protein M1835_008215 [Candelina submexicana]
MVLWTKILSLLSHREFARKTFRKPGGLKKEDIQIFKTELQVLKRIRHEHCVELVGSYTDPKYFGILISPVAECDLKTYYTLAADSSDRLSLFRRFFGCLANALQYLHHSKIRHRDIKPEDILVKGDHVSLTDFGISFDFENLSRSTTTADSANTWLYCAPEVAQYQKRNTSADVWSLGCVFLEMVTVLKGKAVTKMREYFTECNNNYRFYNNIDASRQWMSLLRVASHVFDNVLLDWTTSMLSLEPELRPTAASIFYTIQGYRAQDGVEPASFCGDCCFQEGSTDSSDTGKDAWATDNYLHGADCNRKA